MSTPVKSPLNDLLSDAPSQPSTSTQGAPWTGATPDRILHTTAVPVLMNYSSAPWAPQQWGPNTAAFSAVSPPDPTTGQVYFCLVPSDGMHFDFSLNRVEATGQSSSQAGEFSPTPYLFSLLNGFTAYTGWAYAVDSSTSSHYFLCAASWPTPNPNTLHWTPLNAPPGLFGGPPAMKHYQPTSATVEPQGLWVTGELIWFANTDGSLWQVAISDIVANTSVSLQQVKSTGVVQAVISDNATTPTYYVLSAIPNGSSYDLVEFPAGDPDSAITIQTGWTPGGIKTTPDGSVWHVVSDFSATDPTQPTTAKVSYLVPSFPANGQTPAWVDPFLNADPTFYPAGTTESIIDAVPLSATNILLRTTANYAADQSPAWGYQVTWQLTRVAIGVLDQPAVAFPVYTGDSATAYTQISQALINAPSPTYDIRAQYATISSADASAYYTAIKTLAIPSSFTDAAAWQQVQSDLTAELFNLTFTLSFWEGTQSLVSLQDQLKSQAITYVSNTLSIPTEATLIETDAGTVEALTVIGATMGGTGSVLSLASTVLSACSFPVGSVILGVLSTGASLVSIFCSARASMTTKYQINVSDPMYLISAKLGDLEGVLNQLFANTVTEIGSSLQACAKDAGRLVTVGALARNQCWTNNTAQVVQNSSGDGPPQPFTDYYNACVVSFFAAFVPLITAVNTEVPPEGKQPNFDEYHHKPVYASPIHTFNDSYGQLWYGQLLQYAAAHDQSKPLGVDLDPLLFQTYNVAYVDVFLNWLIPNKPTWI